jgi:hypothetical protein
MFWAHLLTFCHAQAGQAVSLRTLLRMLEGNEICDADREWKDVEAELNDVREGESLW